MFYISLILIAKKNTYSRYTKDQKRKESKHNTTKKKKKASNHGEGEKERKQIK